MHPLKFTPHKIHLTPHLFIQIPFKELLLANILPRVPGLSQQSLQLVIAYHIFVIINRDVFTVTAQLQTAHTCLEKIEKEENEQVNNTQKLLQASLIN